MKKNKKILKYRRVVITLATFFLLYIVFTVDIFSVSYTKQTASVVDGVNTTEKEKKEVKTLKPKLVLDIALYDKKMEELANNFVLGTSTTASTSKVNLIATSTATSIATTSIPVKKPHLWPAKAAYPKAGAILPFNRIVAYYGNFYSTKMGVLGEYSEEIMLQKLIKEVERWTLADPDTPAIPAIHYIVTTAQGSAGADGMYRARMPKEHIERAIAIAEKIHGITFLDIQVGLSNLQAEIPVLKEYLTLPNVHLGIDPEFSMKTGKKPGSVIGTMDAADINFAVQYLANIVKENDLPPKILVVHRFTDRMVTNAPLIQTVPEVQIVIDMDGWGASSHKKKAYLDVIYDEPVQFAGLKLFYKNDLRAPSTGMLTTTEVLKLKPRPIYIQYQ